MKDTPEKVARYINGIIFDIQDELGLFSLRFVEEAYHVALKDEEKMMRKHFDYGEVKEYMKVRFVVTRLRGHASLWWDGVQEERILKN